MTKVHYLGLFLLLCANSYFGHTTAAYSHDLFWKKFVKRYKGETFGNINNRIMAYFIWPNFVFNQFHANTLFIDFDRRSYCFLMTIFGIAPKILVNTALYAYHILYLSICAIALCFAIFYVIFLILFIGSIDCDYQKPDEPLVKIFLTKLWLKIKTKKPRCDEDNPPYPDGNSRPDIYPGSRQNELLHGEENFL